MIKSNPRKNTNPSVCQLCFEKSEHGPELGISFEKRDGTKRFAPYSFLSTADFDGSEKLVFSYTFGTITVQGHSLQTLWKAVCRYSLSRMCESADASSGETSINTITVTDFANAVSDEPLFPEEGR